MYTAGRDMADTFLEAFLIAAFGEPAAHQVGDIVTTEQEPAVSKSKPTPMKPTKKGGKKGC